MANAIEDEIATFDFQTYGTLTLTTKRLYGRLRMPPTPNQLKSGGNIVTTTKGKFYERDFDAPVSTIENMAVKAPTHPLILAGLACSLLGIVGPFFSSWLSLLFLPVGIVLIVLGVKLGKNPTKFLFSFNGNGEIFSGLEVPAMRRADIDAFVQKISAAKSAALK